MKIRVLGAAAGGGFPQWNCNCDNCVGVRDETLMAQPRTQSSIAITANGDDWLLVNASPDIRQQILATPALQPGRAKRDTGIRAVLLVDSQIDHVTGLLMLREHQAPLPLYCTDRVHDDLTTGLPIINLLSHYCGVERHRVPVDGQAFSVPGLEPLVFTAVPLTSKAPPYSPHRDDPRPGDNIGLQIEDPQNGGRAFYAPGLGEVEPHLEAYMAAADLLLVDGTCWTDDEMARRGVGTKRARAMGHLPQSGSDGMLAALRRYPDARKVLIHINNTNPILVEDGAERAQLDAAGIEVAYDGMELQP